MASRRREAAAAAGSAELRVLVVDDNDHARKLVTDVLRAAGVVQAHGACDAVDALHRLATLEPDVIVLDCAMPGLDGVEFARRVRRAAVERDPLVPDPAVPIVMLTGTGSRTVVERARDAGVDEFLAKPFSVGGLLERIEAVVTRRREFVVASAYVGPDRRRRRDPDARFPQRRRYADSEVVPVPPRPVLKQELASDFRLLRELLASEGPKAVFVAAAERRMTEAQARADAGGLALVARAAASLKLYLDRAASGFEAAAAEAHLDALVRLSEFSDEETRRLGPPVVSRLEALVERKAPVPLPRGVLAR